MTTAASSVARARSTSVAASPRAHVAWAPFSPAPEAPRATAASWAPIALSVLQRPCRAKAAGTAARPTSLYPISARPATGARLASPALMNPFCVPPAPSRPRRDAARANTAHQATSRASGAASAAINVPTAPTPPLAAPPSATTASLGQAATQAPLTVPYATLAFTVLTRQHSQPRQRVDLALRRAPHAQWTRRSRLSSSSRGTGASPAGRGRSQSATATMRQSAAWVERTRAAKTPAL